ncbi:Fc.00g004350.m01.CDS01 [Cosmosporella sp. VM-42]
MAEIVDRQTWLWARTYVAQFFHPEFCEDVRRLQPPSPLRSLSDSIFALIEGVIFKHIADDPAFRVLLDPPRCLYHLIYLPGEMFSDRYRSDFRERANEFDRICAPLNIRGMSGILLSQQAFLGWLAENIISIARESIKVVQRQSLAENLLMARTEEQNDDSGVVPEIQWENRNWDTSSVSRS